jgi:hypothetical protein
MRWFKELIEKRKEKWHKNAINGAKSEAKRLFQIKEYNSLLWLTYNGQLVAPFAMLCGGEDVNKCVALLNAIRDLYVKRITDGNER